MTHGPNVTRALRKSRRPAELARADSLALFLGLGAIVVCAALGLFAGGGT